MLWLACHGLATSHAEAQCCVGGAREDGHGDAPAVPVFGRIVAVAHAEPVVAAHVTLERTGAAPTTLRTVSDARGEYNFAMVPAGRWVLHVRALGYRPARIEVDLEGRAPSRLSVGLRLEAITLHPVQVLGVASDAATWAAPAVPVVPARLRAEEARLARYLPSDARVVSASEAREAVPLGEMDVFRGLQRLAGVATRDDLTAELWVRGAGWGQTLVRFDGVPSFAPLHAAGAFSAVPERAIGALSFHPGVQPLAAGGGAGALVLIESRRPSAGTSVRGDAAVSPVSTQLVLTRGSTDGRSGWLVGVRRSTLGLGLGRAIAPELPYRFAEVVARGDRALRGGALLEASVLVARDALTGPIAGWVDSSEARLGSGVARLTLDVPMAGGRVRHTVGASWSAARLGSGDDSRYEPGLQLAGDEPLLRLWDADNAAGLSFVESVWQRAAPAGAPRATLGVRVEHLGARVAGLGLRPRIGDDARARLVIEDAAVVGTLWAERRWELDRVTLEAGTRLESGSAVRGAPAMRLAPRFAVRYAAMAGTYLTVAASRGYQYAQPFSPYPQRLHALASVGTHWLVAGDLPAARGDLATAGVERWIGRANVLSATVYVRTATGIATTDPRPGLQIERQPVVAASQHARGVDVSLRRIAGRLTGSLAYSRGRSEMAVDGERFAAPWSREEVLHATAALAVGRRLSVGSGFTVAGGAPYTRRFGAAVACDRADQCVWSGTPAQDVPSAQRLPRYASLDVTASYVARRASPSLTAVGSLRNLGHTATPGAYMSTSISCIPGSPTAGCDRLPFEGGLSREDHRLSGARRLASAELRVSW